MGVIAEGNPVWRDLIYRNPAAVSATVVAATGGLLAVVYRFRRRCGYLRPMLIGLWAVKVTVIGLHLFWISAWLTS